LEQTGEQKIDAFVAGVGTGGTLMGVGRRLKEINPSCKIIAVEPQESAVLTGNGGFAPHKIHGIGDGFIPELLDVTQVDWTETIKSDNAVAMAKVLCLKYGLMVGISAGANVLAVFNVLQKLGENAGVITILPDRSERYFSTDLFKCKDEKECLKCTRNIESVFCEHR
jgi:cysteine synthase A